MKKMLTFDDVALKPRLSNIHSRLSVDLSTELTENISMGCPILAANMDSVISEALADVLLEYGSIPIMHRFQSMENIERLAQKYKDSCFLSCGYGTSDDEKIIEIAAKYGCGVCIDIAHGHSTSVIRLIKAIKSKYPLLEVIAGNVCTYDGFLDLATAGADAIKVGVGPGSACSTRIKTGFGLPQFSAIEECKKAQTEFMMDGGKCVYIIADGGIRESGDIAKAIVAGASSVMIGKLFASTIESAAKHTESGIVRFRGQASKEFQVEYKGGLKQGTVEEGVGMNLTISGKASELLDGLLGGLRSALSYGGSHNIRDFQKFVEYVEVTPSYTYESHPRT